MRTSRRKVALRYRDLLLVAGALTVGTTGCWHEMPRAGRQAFVESFLTSIRDDTEFHRQYALTRDSSVIGELRPHLGEQFSIRRWSGPLLEDECTVDMADGSRLLLHVIQRERSVQKVALYFYPSSTG
ncbi:MAG: hypothetical protein E4H03_04810 [Myxococcales bacterium]|nr:MAG: hypothetical protein E4H03_04810 [Myxococcales bacterium]